MAVLAIIPNLPARDPAALARFYRAVFGLSVDFDMGWIAFLDAALAALRATGAEPVYGPVQEPWGIRRFFLRDPEGNLVNVAQHREGGDA